MSEKFALSFMHERALDKQREISASEQIILNTVNLEGIAKLAAGISGSIVNTELTVDDLVNVGTVQNFGWEASEIGSSEKDLFVLEDLA